MRPSGTCRCEIGWSGPMPIHDVQDVPRVSLTHSRGDVTLGLADFTLLVVALVSFCTENKCNCLLLSSAGRFSRTLLVILGRSVGSSNPETKDFYCSGHKSTLIPRYSHSSFKSSYAATTLARQLRKLILRYIR